jgi:hypothetical protein
MIVVCSLGSDSLVQWNVLADFETSVTRPLYTTGAPKRLRFSWNCRKLTRGGPVWDTAAGSAPALGGYRPAARFVSAKPPPHGVVTRICRATWLGS